MKNNVMEMVQYAYSEVPYYQELAQNIGMDMSKIEFLDVPILCKKDAVCNSHRLLSPEYMVKQLSGNLIEYYTAGSTGKCMEIFWDNAECKYSLLTLWYYRKKFYNISPEDKFVYFFTSRESGSRYREKEVFDKRIGFCKSNLNWEKMIRIYHEIVEFSPKWMLLQPSLAVLLAEAVEREELEPIQNLQYIELSGEMLWPSVRKKIQYAFPKCKIANQYGANEVNSIAYECPYGKMHCMESNVYMEILDSNNIPLPDGEEGEVCVTSLQNRAMPLIRYKVGDVGIRYQSKCQCGLEGSCLQLTSGRDNDWIYTRDGSKVTPYVFVRAIENVNQKLDYPIWQFQIIQEDYDYFVINLVINEEVIEDIETIFIENISQKEVAGSKFKFNFFREFLPEERNGKLRYFESKLNIC